MNDILNSKVKKFVIIIILVIQQDSCVFKSTEVNEKEYMKGIYYLKESGNDQILIIEDTIYYQFIIVKDSIQYFHMDSVKFILDRMDLRNYKSRINDDSYDWAASVIISGNKKDTIISTDFDSKIGFIKTTSLGLNNIYSKEIIKLIELHKNDKQYGVL